jgi:hypothetical protein
LKTCKIEQGIIIMTKDEAEQTAIGLRAAGWPVVYVEINDDGTWRAVAEDPGARDGWLTWLLLSRIRESFTPLPNRLC